MTKKLLLLLLIVCQCLWLNAASSVSVADFVSLYDEMYDKLSGNGVADCDLNVLRYMRQTRYNDYAWQLSCGTTDPTAAQLLAEYDSRIAEIKDADMTLPDGASLDCIHFVAALNGALSGSGDMTGWAGDLVEYSLEYDSKEFLESGYFSIQDYNADLDAYNINNMSGANVSAKLHQYYLDGNSYRTRNLLFRTDQDVWTRFCQSPNQTMLQYLILKYGTSSDRVQGAAAKMDAYLNAQADAESLAGIETVEADAAATTLLYRLDGTPLPQGCKPQGLYIKQVVTR